MIKKKTVFHSDVTGKYYPSYKIAERAEGKEKAAHIEQLVSNFTTQRKQYNDALDQLRTIHEPMLRETLSELESLGVTEFSIASDNEQDIAAIYKFINDCLCGEQVNMDAE